MESDLHKVYVQTRRVNQDRYALGSKKRLMQMVEKKFRTAMIGTLSRCEDKIGFLWGHGEDTIDGEQERFRAIWDELRTDILNHCNSQLRAAMEEIMQYHISWDKYRTEFIVRKDNKYGS